MKNESFFKYCVAEAITWTWFPVSNFIPQMSESLYNTAIVDYLGKTKLPSDVITYILMQAIQRKELSSLLPIETLLERFSFQEIMAMNPNVSFLDDLYEYDYLTAIEFLHFLLDNYTTFEQAVEAAFRLDNQFDIGVEDFIAKNSMILQEDAVMTDYQGVQDMQGIQKIIDIDQDLDILNRTSATGG